MNAMKHISVLVRNGIAPDDVEIIRRGAFERSESWLAEALEQDDSDKLQAIAERIRATEIRIRKN